VTLRALSTLAAATGLLTVLPALGQEPARLEIEQSQANRARSELTVNQKLANTVAEQLRQSGLLYHYDINVQVNYGTAELSGSVADLAQRAAALRIAGNVAGVDHVRDRLALAGGIIPVQAPAPPIEQAPPPRQVPGYPPPPAPGGEPVPVYQVPQPGPYDLNPPRLPPYAWPTYAPYNNYSRVAYPEAYPYQAFPFIGPYYPFPKVPLGWRKVTLEWEDGHWWYSKTACSHDWWHVRFW
jgi:hypothetical protein